MQVLSVKTMSYMSKSFYHHNIHLDSAGGSPIEIALSWSLQKLRRSVNPRGEQVLKGVQ